MSVALYILLSLFFLPLGPAAVISDPAGDDASRSGANSAHVHSVNEPDSWWPGQHTGQRWLMHPDSFLTPRHRLLCYHTAPGQLNQRDPYDTTICTITHHHLIHHTCSTPIWPNALTALSLSAITKLLLFLDCNFREIYRDYYTVAGDILFSLHHFAPTTMSGNPHVHPVITQEHFLVFSQTTHYSKCIFLTFTKQPISKAAVSDL